MNFLKNFFKPKPVVDFKALVNNGALIVDVRSRDEFQQGHINGSVNLPLMELGTHIKELKRKEYAVITVCRSGARSSLAKDLLVKNDVEAYNGGSWLDLKSRLN